MTARHEAEPFPLVDPAEDRRGADGTVLVVNRSDPPRVGDADAVADGVVPFVGGDLDEALPEPPGRLLAQDPGG